MRRSNMVVIKHFLQRVWVLLTQVCPTLVFVFGVKGIFWSLLGTTSIRLSRPLLDAYKNATGAIEGKYLLTISQENYAKMKPFVVVIGGVSPPLPYPQAPWPQFNSNRPPSNSLRMHSAGPGQRGLLSSRLT